MKTWNDIGHKSAMGVGTWAWGDKSVWGYGKEYTESDVRSAFDTSVAAGMDFFDTAEIYGSGTSEILLGQFIKSASHPVFIATKFMPFPWRLSRKELTDALKRSLGRLGVACVDLYQIHWPLHLRSLETWMDTMADAVEQGLTKTVGVSNYSSDQMKRAHEVLARRNIPLVSNQVEYSLLHRKPERNGLLKTCNELGIKLIAYSPLAMGVLADKYSANRKMTGYRGIRYNRLLPRIQILNGLLREIGQSHGGKSPSQVALNWTICKGTFPIPGAKNAQQAVENAGALGWSLTREEVIAVEAAAEKVR